MPFRTKVINQKVNKHKKWKRILILEIRLKYNSSKHSSLYYMLRDTQKSMCLIRHGMPK
jgi:hypothetical protein